MCNVNVMGGARNVMDGVCIGRRLGRGGTHARRHARTEARANNNNNNNNNMVLSVFIVKHCFFCYVFFVKKSKLVFCFVFFCLKKIKDSLIFFCFFC